MQWIQRNIHLINTFYALEISVSSFPDSKPINMFSQGHHLKHIKQQHKFAFSALREKKFDIAFKRYVQILHKTRLLKKTTETQYLLSEIYNEIGVIQQKKGQFETAITYYHKSIQCLLTSNTDPMYSISIGIVYSNVASCNYQLQKYSISLKHFKKSGIIFQNMQDHMRFGETLYNSGLILIIQKKYSSSLETLSEALTIFIELKRKEMIGLIYKHFADIHCHKKEIEEAKFYLKTSLNYPILPDYLLDYYTTKQKIRNIEYRSSMHHNSKTQS